MEATSTSQIGAIPLVGPLLPSLQGSCQETVGTEGLEAPAAGHEVWRGSHPGTVYAGSQRWSLLGDSRLGGSLGFLATG